jgi:hypothetical protein
MQTLCERITAHAANLPEGTPISAKELLHLGGRAAVDQALSRLVRRGALMRVRRGVYVRPIETRFGRRAPSVSRIVNLLARLRGETITRHGAAAANGLGLTTQVPVRPVYLTSGPNSSLKVGGQMVELKHVPPKQLSAPNEPAGEAIRAMIYLGPAHVCRVLEKLSETEIKKVMSLRPVLPTNLAAEVSAFANRA